jgi:hypothetical protein
MAKSLVPNGILLAGRWRITVSQDPLLPYHHVVRPMYDATNQENTSLTRTVLALLVIIGCGIGNDGQHMSGRLAVPMSRKSATTFGQGTMLEPSTSHIGKGVALVAQAAAFVYIYARISQIAEMTLSFHATTDLYHLH